MNPILVALISGIVVGCIPSLQFALFDHQGMLFVFGSSMRTVGNVVPVVGITILAASLGINLLQHSQQKTKSQSKASVALWVGLASLVKLFLVPAVGGWLFYMTEGSEWQNWLWPSSLNARLVVVQKQINSIFSQLLL